MNARRELFNTARGLRGLGGIWEGCRLAAKQKVLPHDVPWEQVSPELTKLRAIKI